MRKLRPLFLLSTFLIISLQHSFASESPKSYAETVNNIHQLMMSYHYNPKELQQDAYQKSLTDMKEMAKKVSSEQDFINGFNRIWREGPFSHVQLAKARQSAEQLANYLDSMQVGGSGAALTWKDDVAILTVNTMMGLDTIDQINQAYAAMAEKKARSLIIDLRQNEGGAFAVKPLVSHLIEQPQDVGYFISQLWTSGNQELPSPEQVRGNPPWVGWSIKAFWHDAQNQAITRVQFQPQTPKFDGKVFVLTSKKTASAAEMAAQTLSNLNNVTLIGETTAGTMLSQKMYDVDGFHLFLPIADYYTLKGKRIEGAGVDPDIAIEDKLAMQKALSLVD